MPKKKKLPGKRRNHSHRAASRRGESRANLRKALYASPAVSLPSVQDLSFFTLNPAKADSYIPQKMMKEVNQDRDRIQSALEAFATADATSASPESMSYKLLEVTAWHFDYFWPESAGSKQDEFDAALVFCHSLLKPVVSFIKSQKASEAEVPWLVIFELFYQLKDKLVANEIIADDSSWATELFPFLMKCFRDAYPEYEQEFMQWLFSSAEMVGLIKQLFIDNLLVVRPNHPIHGGQALILVVLHRILAAPDAIRDDLLDYFLQSATTAITPTGDANKNDASRLCRILMLAWGQEAGVQYQKKGAVRVDLLDCFLNYYPCDDMRNKVAHFICRLFHRVQSVKPDFLPIGEGLIIGGNIASTVGDLSALLGKLARQPDEGDNQLLASTLHIIEKYRKRLSVYFCFGKMSEETRNHLMLLCPQQDVVRSFQKWVDAADKKANQSYQSFMSELELEQTEALEARLCAAFEDAQSVKEKPALHAEEDEAESSSEEDESTAEIGADRFAARFMSDVARNKELSSDEKLSQFWSLLQDSLFQSDQEQQAFLLSGLGHLPFLWLCRQLFNHKLRLIPLVKNIQFLLQRLPNGHPLKRHSLILSFANFDAVRYRGSPKSFFGRSMFNYIQCWVKGAEAFVCLAYVDLFEKLSAVSPVLRYFLDKMHHALMLYPKQLIDFRSQLVRAVFGEIRSKADKLKFQPDGPSLTTSYARTCFHPSKKAGRQNYQAFNAEVIDSFHEVVRGLEVLPGVSDAPVLDRGFYSAFVAVIKELSRCTKGGVKEISSRKFTNSAEVVNALLGGYKQSKDELIHKIVGLVSHHQLSVSDLFFAAEGFDKFFSIGLSELIAVLKSCSFQAGAGKKSSVKLSDISVLQTGGATASTTSAAVCFEKDPK